MVRIELQGAGEPAAQAVRQRLEAAARRYGPHRRHQFVEAQRELVVAERTTEYKCQRHDAELQRIGPGIEPGARLTGRHGHAQFTPVALAREPQLLDRGAEHRLGNEEARLRRHDQPLGRQRPVRHVAHPLVKPRHAGDELPDEAEGRIDVERHTAGLRATEDRREAQAGHRIRDDGQHRVVADAPFHPTHAHERRVTEAGKTPGPFAQSELERRHGAERGAQPQHLDSRPPGRVSVPRALAEAVLEDDRRRIGKRMTTSRSVHGGQVLG